MRRYADPVEVRQGPVDQGADQGATEGPQQFLWRGRLWKVRAVLAHWVETGPWWQATGARAVIGSEDAAAETETRDRAASPWATCSPSASCGGSRPAAADPRPTASPMVAGSSTWPSTGPTGAGRSSAAPTETGTEKP